MKAESEHIGMDDKRKRKTLGTDMKLIKTVN